MKRQSRYRGVELHRNCFTLYARGVATCAGTLRPREAVAGEATGNLRWLCLAPQAPGERLLVVNPHRFELISRSGKKTDTQEAEWLGEWLAKGLLPEEGIQDEVATRVARLAQAREKLVKLRPLLRNQLTHLLAARGKLLRQEGLASARGRAAVLVAAASELERRERDSLGGEIRRWNQSSAKVEELLRTRSGRLPGWSTLTNSTGSGAVGLSSLRSPIGSVADFPRKGKLAAPCGIVPRLHHSSATERRGHSTKRRAPRSVARPWVHCALIAARYPPSLQPFSRRLAATRGTCKAIIALARKVLGVSSRTLKHN